MKTNTFLTGCLLAAAGVGCGSVSGIPIEKTATDFAAAICPKAYDCCTADQLMGNKDLAGTTEAECESKTAQDFRNKLQTMQDAENAGRAKYDQAQVDMCLSAIRAATCETLTAIRSLSGLPACNSTFATPLVAAGGKCQNDFECIGGVCQKPDGSFDGVCVAGNAAGAACAGSNRCAPELICDGRGTSTDASDDVCVAAQENGATCVDGFDCNSRNCVADANGAKTCQAVTAPQCFYGGGCSASGGRPGAGALILMGLFVLVALLRTRRTGIR
jgi:uncharacterized protein (TIGR03382 family)